MTVRVLVVSTHRSDRGHYGPLLRVLDGDSRVDYHVCEGRGRCGHRRVGRFDVAVVLGDRVEMLIAAAEIVESRVPLVHIHGGEHTTGSVDEKFRWAMSSLADRHCVAHEEARRELARYRPDHTITVTGAPGLDDILERKPPKGLRTDIIVHYNPALDEETTRREWTAIKEAIGDRIVTWVRPNGDRFSPTTDGVEWESEEYRDHLAAAKVIVGNSSAGIIEAPSLGVWTVNVGRRQRGRIHGDSVLDVADADAATIRVHIDCHLKHGRFSGPNPYRHPEGKASEAIRDVILEVAR